MITREPQGDFLKYFSHKIIKTIQTTLDVSEENVEVLKLYLELAYTEGKLHQAERQKQNRKENTLIRT